MKMYFQTQKLQFFHYRGSTVVDTNYNTQAEGNAEVQNTVTESLWFQFILGLIPSVLLQFVCQLELPVSVQVPDYLSLSQI